jgi:hypothetical protein
VCASWRLRHLLKFPSEFQDNPLKSNPCNLATLIHPGSKNESARIHTVVPCNPKQFQRDVKTPMFNPRLCRAQGYQNTFHLIELVSKEKEDGNCIEAERPNGSMSSIGSYGSSSCVMELNCWAPAPMFMF